MDCFNFESEEKNNEILYDYKNPITDERDIIAKRKRQEALYKKDFVFKSSKKMDFSNISQ